MPGGTNAILAQIKANKAAGVDPTAGVPDAYKVMAKAVIGGQETLKDITSTRGAQTRNLVNEIILTLEPDYNEGMSEARQVYRKQYTSGKNTDIGGQVKSINKLAGHANAIGQASLNMNNISAGGAKIIAGPANWIGNQFNSTPEAGLKRAADEYSNELSSYLSGKGGSGQDERKARAEAFASYSTPQQMGESLLTDIEFLEKQMEGNEQHRNAVFPKKEVQDQFPLVSPQAREQLNQAKAKAHKLIGDYDEWSKNPEGAAALGQSIPSSHPVKTIPTGVSVKKLPD